MPYYVLMYVLYMYIVCVCTYAIYSTYICINVCILCVCVYIPIGPIPGIGGGGGTPPPPGGGGGGGGGGNPPSIPGRGGGGGT